MSSPARACSSHPRSLLSPWLFLLPLLLLTLPFPLSPLLPISPLCRPRVSRVSPDPRKATGAGSKASYSPLEGPFLPRQLSHHSHLALAHSLARHGSRGRPFLSLSLTRVSFVVISLSSFFFLSLPFLIFSFIFFLSLPFQYFPFPLYFSLPFFLLIFLLLVFSFTLFLLSSFFLFFFLFFGALGIDSHCVGILVLSYFRHVIIIIIF